MENLATEESEKLFTEMISGKMPEEKIREQLVALSAKGETADEIFGAVKALQKEMVPFEYPGDLIDVCGTGGDGWKTLNISTAVSFVIAACGLKVVKHGNRAISSISGSSDVLRALGVDYKPELARECLDETNFCYLHAPDYHPALKNLAGIRQRISQRTIFNLIGPLLNPARPKFQLVGVYEHKLSAIYAEVLVHLGVHKAWVVNGNDGLDEISGQGLTHVCEVDENKFHCEKFVSPQDAELHSYPTPELIGGDPDFNAAAMMALLSGDQTERPAYREIVLLNSAASLLIGGKVKSLPDGALMAKEAIDSGKALAVLEKLRKITK